MPTVMSNVTFVPSGWYNLFSMTKLIKNGWMLHGGINTGITLTQDGKEIHFGEKVHTTKGILFVAKIQRQATPSTKLGPGQCDDQTKERKTKGNKQCKHMN